MKWISHSAIGGTSAAIVDPVLIPAAVLGATAPDWLEWVLSAGGVHITHRKETHYLIVWLLFFAASIPLAGHGVALLWLSAFAWGGFTHILTDALTVQGVPFSPNSRRRFHLFGGRLRTGSPQEFIIAGAISAAFVLVAWQLHKDRSADFIPYFYDWSGAYERGILDAYEWKQNRWKFI
ncbi:MAG: metal-dependent hydrolase [Thiomicrospira sp.]|jgi:inner membrane protein|nr:metal-dependent hydrolase [Thiomicrospira sp.]